MGQPASRPNGQLTAVSCSTCGGNRNYRRRQYKKKDPRLIIGGLSVELDLMVYGFLSAKDLINVSSTCRHANAVVNRYARYLAGPLIKHEKRRLQAECDYLDFDGLSFVTAWRRFSEFFNVNLEVHDDTEDANHTRSLSRALAMSYVRANFGNRPLVYFDYMETMKTILGISDWGQYYGRGVPKKTWLANRLDFRRWRWALTEASGYGNKGAYGPGRYGALVMVFRDDAPIPATEDPSFIVQAFKDVSAIPLRDLSKPSSYTSSIYYSREREAQLTDCNHLRRLQLDLSLPTWVNGIWPFLSPRDEIARLLLYWIYQDDVEQDGLVYAALLNEMEVKWGVL